VNVVFSREANTKKCIDFFQLMYFKCSFRLSNGESCMQALIHVINMFADGVLETAKGDRGLSLTQLLEVIFDLVHRVARRSKQDLSILIIQLHAAGLIRLQMILTARGLATGVGPFQLSPVPFALFLLFGSSGIGKFVNGVLRRSMLLRLQLCFPSSRVFF